MMMAPLPVPLLLVLSLSLSLSLLLAPSALAYDPFATTPAPDGPPEGALMCVVPVSGGKMYIEGNEKGTHVDDAARTCVAYWCDGSTGLAQPWSSKSCGAQCVHPDSLSTHSCQCYDCPTGEAQCAHSQMSKIRLPDR